MVAALAAAFLQVASGAEPGQNAALPRTLDLPVSLVSPGRLLLVPTLQSNASFRSQHPLLGRISANIERAGLTSPIDPGNEPASSVEIRNRGVLRAAKKAVKGFILDDMDLYHRGSDSSSVTAPGSDRGARVHFGVSHLAPKVDVRLPAGAGTVRLSLTALGNAGIDINSAGAGNARVHLGYDQRSKTTAVSFRLAF